jgi:hypothetical protein
MALVYELPQQLSGQRIDLQRAFLADQARAVHPDAVHADRVGGEARVAARQVEDAAPRPAVHPRRVEEEQIGVVADLALTA